MTLVIDLDLDALRASLAGELIASGEDGWDEHRQAFNTAFVQDPALVAVPADVRDVQAIVRHAAAAGLRVAAQRTGHNAEPLEDLRDVLLVKTTRLDGVEIWPAARRARVGSGAKWADVLPRASELGLAALHGSTPDVSVVGYCLGGGVGWYARALGLAANAVLAIELVTPDGRLRRVDRDHEPELFWALRGGGGSFGVVTAIEIELFPIAEVYAGVLFFPIERASEVLHAWHAWTRTVPDDVTSVGRILRFPPLPLVPEPLRGRDFAVVEAVVLGDAAAGAALLEPLRRLGPAIDTFAMQPPLGIAELHMDPPTPLPYRGEHLMLDDLDASAIDRLVEAAGPCSGSALVSVEVRHVGGALARRPDDAGALGTLDCAYLMFAIGIAPDDAVREVVQEHIDRVIAALAPWDTGRQYLSFTEEPTNPRRFYREDAYRRLRALRTVVDPDDLMRANHPIPQLP